jgi:hypothetical protein
VTPPQPPYTPAEWRRIQRVEDRRVAQEDLAGMVAELARTRTVPWADVAERLAAFTLADWKALSTAAGRPRRVPPTATRGEVLAAVRTLAGPR